MVEHRAFQSSHIQENDTGVVVLQVPWSTEEFLPKEERANTFSDFRVFNKTPDDFLLLHVLEPMK